METIQVVIDSKLRQTADRLAKRKKVNRSALVREALREYAKRERIREMEERDRRGYEAQPETGDDWPIWEREAVWPEE
ncbi:MAG TPA: ribbon-helix-helix domain-containing protein [Bryobacteraceae bacterium]|nr:ribbon-helix-helix domain-containing protein [Bryobacteraceae bacterium]